MQTHNRRGNHSHTGKVCSQTYIQRKCKQTSCKLTADESKLHTNYTLIHVSFTPTHCTPCHTIPHLVTLSSSRYYTVSWSCRMLDSDWPWLVWVVTGQMSVFTVNIKKHLFQRWLAQQMEGGADGDQPREGITWPDHLSITWLQLSSWFWF